MKPEYLMLAQTYDVNKHSGDHVSGWFVSEKLDGMRALWDGGLSRGLPIEKVPYANTNAEERFVEKTVCSGLWSRSGKPIACPDSILDKLPYAMIDMELWCGRGKFQQVMSIVKDRKPSDAGWAEVKMMILDFPSPIAFLATRRIKMDKTRWLEIPEKTLAWATLRYDRKKYRGFWSTPRSFSDVRKSWEGFKLFPPQMVLHEQATLAENRVGSVIHDTTEEIRRLTKAYTKVGAEGLVLRNPKSVWTPERSHDVLKVKPSLDDVGVVIGYTTGRKDRRLHGMIGALVLKWGDIIFEIAGIGDKTRTIHDPNVREWALQNPDSRIPAFKKGTYSNHDFPLGTRVEFAYRELTDAGVPKEARVVRIRPEE